MKKAFAALGAALVVVLASPAAAHVTVQPNEGVIDTFSRFVVRVPTERDVPTTEITVEFPPLASVSFEPKDGWEREVEMTELDEPIEAFGQEITETVGKVTWSGGRIGPGEFLEFGFSAKMPDGEETMTFDAIQTYTGGEVVRWTGAPDSETPAASLTTYDLGLEEGQGELAALAELRGGAAEPDGDAGDDGGTGTATILSGLALVVAMIALVLSVRRGAKT